MIKTHSRIILIVSFLFLCLSSFVLLSRAQGAIEPLEQRNLFTNSPSPVWKLIGQPKTFVYGTDKWQLTQEESLFGGLSKRVKGLVIGQEYELSLRYTLSGGLFDVRLTCGSKCVAAQHSDQTVSDSSVDVPLRFTAKKEWVDVLVRAKAVKGVPAQVLIDQLDLVHVINNPEPEPTKEPTPEPVPQPDLLPEPTPEPEPTPQPIPATDAAYAAASTAGLLPGAFPVVPARPYVTQGKTYYVATTGDNGNNGSKEAPWRTIAQATKKAASGDVVVVAGGTYKDCESYSECYELTFQTPNVIWTAAQGESVVIVPSGLSKRGLNLLGNHITVDGFTFRGFTGAGIVTTWAQSAATAPKGQVLRNVTVDMQGNPFTDGIGFYGYHEGMRMENVTVIGATIQGITCAAVCNNVRMDHVLVKMTAAGGGSGADAIGFEGGNNILITNTEVTGASADGVDIKGTQLAIFDSSVHDIARNGIKFWGGGDIVRTQVTRTGADAAVVSATGDLRLLESSVTHHNQATGATSYVMTFGYDTQAPVKISLINTTVCANTGGIYVPASGTLTIEGGFVEPKAVCPQGF